MLHRLLTVAVTALVLSACTDADWDRSLSSVGLSDKEPQPTAPAAGSKIAGSADSVAPNANLAEDWCTASARHAADRARELGFDQATQKLRAKEELDQCHKLLKAN